MMGNTRPFFVPIRGDRNQTTTKRSLKSIGRSVFVSEPKNRISKWWPCRPSCFSKWYQFRKQPSLGCPTTLLVSNQSAEASSVTAQKRNFKSLETKMLKQIDGWTDIGHINLLSGLITHNQSKNDKNKTFFHGTKCQSGWRDKACTLCFTFINVTKFQNIIILPESISN